MGIDDLIFKTSSNTKATSSNPIDIFNYLDKKDGYGYLRTNQSDFLSEWEKRRNERDIVGIMHTGAGKTLVGLLMLHSKMVEEQLPVIYLCPTTQLVEQVCNQGINYGINVCRVNEDKTLPDEFLNSEKILVTTFSKLYNGRTVFGNKTFSDQFVTLGSILIDDAHSCVDYARKHSTISIDSTSEEYKKLFRIFKSELTKQSNGKCRSIEDGEYSTCMRVPYWIWKDNISEIKNIIHDYAQNNSDFEYRMISETIDFASCFISGTKIEITPKITPIEQIPSYARAKHRYILSATINERDLCYELGIEREAITNPIITSSYIVDVGERLILSPSKYHKDITDNFMRQWIFNECKNKSINLVVIVPSTKASLVWEKLGAKIIDEEQHTFEEIMGNLKSGNSEQIVLINRYDGIDFSGDLSHMLVLDGMPIFSTNQERANGNSYRDDRLNSKLAQKIEQGMGRTVRSNSDYSVVILLGNELTRFVSLKNNLLLFSPATREQLKISNDITSSSSLNDAKEAFTEIKKSISYCLSREEAWVKYSKNQLSQVNLADFSNPELDKIQFEFEAFQYYKNNNITQAEKTIQNWLNISKDNTEVIGQIYQEKAEILYNVDRVKSENLQKLAADKWDGAFKPQHNKIQREIKNIDLVNESYKFIKEFTDKNSYSDFISETINNLVYDNDSSSELFEESIKQLGNILGLESQRPEKLWDDGGPDNLWLSPEKHLVIECKNNEINNIDKDDIKQLGHSSQWFTNKYGNHKKPLLLLFHGQKKLEHNVQVSSLMYVVDQEKLDQLKSKLEIFRELVIQNFSNLNLDNLRQYLSQCDLLIDSFIATYMRKLK
ncbi:DEAD/DEAH box helicase [Lactococcus cremoris]|uniref:DEAD/DEAH box helicase n=1 Tax=Lactococcus lactis subsp. cremoris TaxID=1359 RepID=UPI0024A700B1|nr:DEAD/DEAH box helicase [Lactococcus cremoris]